MVPLRIPAFTTIACFLSALPMVGAEVEDRPKQLQTESLGGVDVPSTAVLKAMHQSQYILYAADGELSQIPVEKVLLPHDSKATPQAALAVLAPDGIVYAGLTSIMAKSADGGRTWTSHPRGAGMEGAFSILSNGTFIGLAGYGKTTEPVEVVTSQDEGRTWQKTSEIRLPPNWDERYFNWISRFANDTLVVSMDVREDLRSVGDGVYEGKLEYLTWRSTDMGKTWQGPNDLNRAGGEGGAVQTPSGKILASIRHQPLKGVHEPAGHFKNVFLLNSDDQGKTWYGLRPLTTVYGQTFGSPVVLRDGTVIVVHDTRYGPGGPGSRAMISFDEGNAWEDKVYYLDYSTFPGSYSASVMLDDDTILTIAGSSQAGTSWTDIEDKTDFYAIRWKPVKTEK